MATPDLSLDSLYSCRGKRVVVTGGTRGIGLMIASAFVQNGAVVYVFSRKPDDAAAAALTARGPGKAFAMACDVSDEAEVRRVAAEIAKVEPGGIHCLVNNSGATWGASFDETPKKSFDKLMGVNVTGLFMVSQAFAPLLDKTASADDPARIINIASIDGINVPSIEEYAYAASKSAVIHLTRTMAAYLSRRQITVNAISPGLFPSKMGDQVIGVLGDEVARAIPQGRAGRPSDVAAAALYLAGMGGAYTTGANIVIDGGLTVKPHSML